MLKHVILLLCMTIAFMTNSMAQKWEGGILLGLANYQGDVTDPVWDLKETNYSAGLIIRHHLKDRIALRGNLLFGKVAGSDINHESDDWIRGNRGFTFESSVTELSLKLEYSPLAGDWLDREGKFKKKINPYAFVGLGVAFWSPTNNFNDSSDSALIKRLQNRIAEDKEEVKSNKSGFVIPVGAGVKADLNEKIVIGAELGFRPTFNDYLDGISQSANPDRNDWYWFGAATLTFRLADSNKDPLPMLTDTDKDGVPDTADACPNVFGKPMFDGCPDSDSDGVMDKDDKCPTLAGTINGCPDTDGDGLADNVDNCPNERGAKENNGCPTLILDSDGDGIADKDDKCPTVAGLINGCPDSDRDGIADNEDACPSVAGPKIFVGCPDSDGDGVQDSKDRCPTVAGVASNGGCPGITSSDRATLDLVVRNVRFETASAVLKVESFVQLDKVVAIMNKYPEYSLQINGYTDNVGNSDSNLRLSERRAKSCYDFLITKGISTSRMIYKGYGEANPVSTNDTRDGRRLNRRVEFDLY